MLPSKSTTSSVHAFGLPLRRNSLMDRSDGERVQPYDKKGVPIVYILPRQVWSPHVPFPHEA